MKTDNPRRVVRMKTERHLPFVDRLLRGRTTWTLFLAVVFIVIMGSLRPDRISGLYVDAFWGQKARWVHCADVVIGGDSRVGIGVSPAEMKRELGELRIKNYGFNANGYSEAYLRALENVLDPDGKSPIIVLGISPRSLSEASGEQNFFTEYQKLSRADLFLASHLGPLLRFVEPMSYGQAWDRVFNQKEPSYYIQDYQSDGWISSQKYPERPDQKLNNYRADFESHPVCPVVVDQLLAAVSGWTKRQIGVYGFRPPTTSAMVELENECSGFDQGDFIERFEAAGGQWLGLNQADYPSYDGSHLRSDGAVSVSKALAQAIRQQRERGGPEGVANLKP